jgi:hypothetical protein
LCDSCDRNISADEYSNHLKNCEAQSVPSQDVDHKPTNEDGPEKSEEGRGCFNVEVLLCEEVPNESIAPNGKFIILL